VPGEHVMYTVSRDMGFLEPKEGC